MKLTVLGGGGVRSPFLAGAIVHKANDLDISEIVFMDNDKKKLLIYGGLAREIALRINDKIKFTLTVDPVEALKDADFVITTLRVGQDYGRVLDEKIALKYGTLGQETTGAGGFAMAMRSIPVLKSYCNIALKYAKPGVLIFNFTNPSGLVTQALRDEGFTNVYGICDNPSEFKKEIADMINAEHAELSMECFGLNHLSWFRSIKHNGVEIIHELIDSKDLYEKTEMKYFGKELVKSLGMLPNGYLYYYYFKEEAVNNINKTGKTRGESILDINSDMTNKLSVLSVEKDFKEVMEVYLKSYNARENSYMAIESGTAREKPRKELKDMLLKDRFDGGYAGGALDFIESYHSGKESEIVLSFPNSGSIDGLAYDDIVEITCNVRNGAVEPIKIGEVPKAQYNLIKQVKSYERLSVEAINKKSMDLAMEALMMHPLVNNNNFTYEIVKEYIEAHRAFIGNWK